MAVVNLPPAHGGYRARPGIQAARPAPDAKPPAGRVQRASTPGEFQPGDVATAVVRGVRQRIMFVGWPNGVTGWVSETGQTGPMSDDDIPRGVRTLTVS